MRLSQVKRRNRIIGIIGAAVLFQYSGLDQRLRAFGGTAFSLAVLLALFVSAPMVVEYAERALRRKK